MIALQGSKADGPGPPLLAPPVEKDVNFGGMKIKGGVKLWTMGTWESKILLLSRLKNDKPGPNYIHMSSNLPDEFFKQITAQQLKRTIDPKTGFEKDKIICTRVGGDDHAFDAVRICISGMSRILATVDFNRLGAGHKKEVPAPKRQPAQEDIRRERIAPRRDRRLRRGNKLW